MMLIGLKSVSLSYKDAFRVICAEKKDNNHEKVFGFSMLFILSGFTNYIWMRTKKLPRKSLLALDKKKARERNVCVCSQLSLSPKGGGKWFLSFGQFNFTR